MTGESSTISTRGGAGAVYPAGQWWAPRRLWQIIGASLIVIAVIVAIVLACNWPYTQQAVTRTLQDRFARTAFSDVGEIARWGSVLVAMILSYPTFRRAVQ